MGQQRVWCAVHIGVMFCRSARRSTSFAHSAAAWTAQSQRHSCTRWALVQLTACKHVAAVAAVTAMAAPLSGLLQLPVHDYMEHSKRDTCSNTIHSSHPSKQVLGDRLHCVFVDNGLLRYKVSTCAAGRSVASAISAHRGPLSRSRLVPAPWCQAARQDNCGWRPPSSTLHRHLPPGCRKRSGS